MLGTLAAAVLMLPTPAMADVLDSRWEQIEVPPGAVATDVLAGRVGQVIAHGDGPFVAGGATGATQWLRLRFEPPSPGARSRRDGMVLWLERVPLAAIRVHEPVGGPPPAPRSAFVPATHDPLLFTAHAFALQPATVRAGEVLLELRSPTRHAVDPQILGLEAFAERDRRRAVMFATIYSGMGVLVLMALVLALALRDPGWALLCGFTVASVLLLLVVNGHAYAMPWLSVLGWSGSLGVSGLACMALATGLVLTAQLCGLFQTRRQRQRVLAAVAAAVVAGAAGLSGVGLSAVAWQALLAAVCAAIAVACLGMGVVAWRRGTHAAWLLVLVWLGLLVTGGLGMAYEQGLLESAVTGRYAFQFALAASAFVLAAIQADRMIEFRRFRERAQHERQRLGADLATEQVRRHFIEELQASMRAADAHDVAWLAFRRLLESVRELMPQRDAAVIAFGYQGLDLLLAEPLGLKADYSRLLNARGSTVKGACRARKPVVLYMDEVETSDGSTLPGGVFAAVPLHIARPAWGVMLVRRGIGEAFGPEELQLLAEFAEVAVGAADEAAGTVDLRRWAELDPLTGALNRRVLDGRLRASMERAHVERRQLSVLFVDIDHFKAINDRHGHGVGDDCLRMTADCVRRQLGKHDLFARYGGEEFIIVLPDTDARAARELAERVREAIAGLRVVGDEATVSFTASIGLASRTPSERDPGFLLERADKALYEAKRSGRNRVQVASGQGLGVAGVMPEGF